MYIRLSRTSVSRIDIQIPMGGRNLQNKISIARRRQNPHNATDNLLTNNLKIFRVRRTGVGPKAYHGKLIGFSTTTFAYFWCVMSLAKDIRSGTSPSRQL